MMISIFLYLSDNFFMILNFLYLFSPLRIIRIVFNTLSEHIIIDKSNRHEFFVSKHFFLTRKKLKMIFKIIILTLVCTYVVCNDMKESTLPEVPKDGTCVKGQSYRLDCNTCHCFGNNQLGCTLKGCLPPDALLK